MESPAVPSVGMSHVDDVEGIEPEVAQVPRDTRPKWGRKLEFILACMGYAVGLGNIWRFPYLCYQSGGGAFLIPYFIMLIVCGVPLLYMEISIGQFTRMGPTGAIGKLAPLFKGAGLATVIISFLFCSYYNVIITWAFYYLFNSFQSPLPWASCNNTWNTKLCWDDYSPNASLYRPNKTVSPTQEYYDHRVLERTAGIEDMGYFRWELVLILLLCWVLVYFCIWKGVKSTGKVVYFTALFPYLILFIMLGRGLTLEGAEIGINFFIKPRWELLFTAKVWVNAAAQNFNSIGVAFGSMIALASYNKPNNIIIRDVLPVSLINSVTSLVAGFAIFSVLGHISFKQGRPIESVVSEGPGLVFIVYPEAFSSMPVAPLWAVLFFVMLILLGIDSQFASVEVICTTLHDHLEHWIKRYLKRKEVMVLIVCIVQFLFGLPTVMQGGVYYFKIIDNFASGKSLMVVAFFECIAVTWFYGAKKLSKDVKDMTGTAPFIYFTVCWYVFSPLLILGILIFGYIQYNRLTYDEYLYPLWAEGLGWCLAAMSLLCIPGGMIHALYKAKGDTFLQRLRNSIQPQLHDTAVTMLEAERDPPPYDKVTDPTIQICSQVALTPASEKETMF